MGEPRYYGLLNSPIQARADICSRRAPGEQERSQGQGEPVRSERAGLACPHASLRIDAMTLARSRPGDRERPKADGLFAGRIAWKLRLFVLVDASGVDVPGRVLARHPVERILAKDAAS